MNLSGFSLLRQNKNVESSCRQPDRLAGLGGDKIDIRPVTFRVCQLRVGGGHRTRRSAADSTLVHPTVRPLRRRSARGKTVSARSDRCGFSSQYGMWQTGLTDKQPNTDRWPKQNKRASLSACMRRIDPFRSPELQHIKIHVPHQHFGQ